MRNKLALGTDLEGIWFLLCRAAGGSTEPGTVDAGVQQQQQARPCLSLDYDQFTQAGLGARELIGPHVEVYFQPSTFLRLMRDVRGAVPATTLFRYLCARSTLLRLRSELGALNQGGSGSLTPAQLAAWLEGVAPKAALAEALVGVGDWAAAVGARLLLLHRRHGRLAIRELVASPAVHELASTLDLLAGTGGQGGRGRAPAAGLLPLGPQAWASPAAVAQLRARFNQLDADRDGWLSQAEFAG